MKIHSSEEIAIFHSRLHELCDKPALRPTGNDEHAWQRFLFEMAPLEDAGDLGGPFDIADLVAVMLRRERERKEGIGWGRMPSSILRDPEKFRDQVLEERAKARRSRPRPQPKREPLVVGDTTVETFPDPVMTHDAEPLSDAMAEFLRGAPSPISDLQ